ncbi:MAG: primosomal protein N' [Candidatus Gygaella obscura]|nr:primosomal protein N' [Candidatus Gygaella obscura]
MKFAEVVVGLPIDGPFDYSIPDNLTNQAKAGSRVSVMFHNRKLTGYVLKIKESSIFDNDKIKPIIEVVDKVAIINSDIYNLAKEISDYYCCSLGQAIETILPEGLKKSKRLFFQDANYKDNKKAPGKITAAFGYNDTKKYSYVLELIKKYLSINQQVLIIVPQLSDINRWQEVLKIYQERIVLLHSYQKHKEQVDSWFNIASSGKKIAIGTMSAVFSTGKNIGLIVIDEESSFVYKQRQFPFYHVRDIAKIRSRIENKDVLFLSQIPSIDTFYQSYKGNIEKVGLEKKQEAVNVRIIDSGDIRRQNLLISPYLEDRLSLELKKKNKVLLFLNRRGHSNILRCDKCSYILRCKRCSAALVFDNKTNELSCHLCEARYPVIDSCPKCNSKYVKFSGIGIEKIANRIKFIFPNARLKLLDRQTTTQSLVDFDILISTSSVFNLKERTQFDLTCVLSLDEGMDMPDFRNNENTFTMLSKINSITKKEMIVQTRHPDISYLKYLKDMDFDSFFKQELKERKQFNFPPYCQLIAINMRSKKEDLVGKKINELYESLIGLNISDLQVFKPVMDSPYKLRNSYRWQVVMKVKDFSRVRGNIKKIANDYYQSGIITTINVDI